MRLKKKQCIDENACDVTIVVMMTMVVVMPLSITLSAASPVPERPKYQDALAHEPNLLFFSFSGMSCQQNRAEGMIVPGRIIGCDEVQPGAREENPISEPLAEPAVAEEIRQK